MEWIKYVYTMSEGQESKGRGREFDGETSIVNALKSELMAVLF